MVNTWYDGFKWWYFFFRWAKYFDKLNSINSRRVLYASPVSELAFKHTMKQFFNFH